MSRSAANWDPGYLHLAAAVNVPTAAAIDTAIAGDADIKMLGPFGPGDAGVESVRCRKTVYVPAPRTTSLRRQSTRRPHRLPPVACDTQGRGGAGHGTDLLATYRFALRKQDGTSPVSLGLGDFPRSESRLNSV